MNHLHVVLPKREMSVVSWVMVVGDGYETKMDFVFLELGLYAAALGHVRELL
jgi:hypothetical protein